MRGSTIAVVLPLLLTVAAPARANDPFDALVATPKGSSACFVARYDAAHLKAHRGQRTTEVLLSLLRGESVVGELEMRLRFRRADRKRPFHVVGSCLRLEPDSSAAPLDAADRERYERTLACQARGGLGGSAEEGGEFDLELAADGGSLLLRNDYGLSGWYGTDQSGPSDFLDLGEEDLVFRLKPVDRATCAEMEKTIAVD
jgi:hypothetical protein